MSPIFCTTSKEAQTRAGEALCAFLVEAKKKSQPVLLLLSGGSAFLLLTKIPKDVLGKHVTIGMLDERFSTDESINNFAQFTKTIFYTNACLAGALFIDTRIVEHETQEALAARFEKALHDWDKAHMDGVVVTTMGVGVDGHTAGIMPFPENPTLFWQLFEDETKLVASYDAGDKNPYPLRVTVTASFLRKQITRAVVYVTGEEKKDALKYVLMMEGSLADTPARIFHEMPDVHFFCSIL